MTVDAKKHECPYGGRRKDGWGNIFGCGLDGKLCDRCREDRADRRNAEAVAGLREGLATWQSAIMEVVEDGLVAIAKAIRDAAPR